MYVALLVSLVVVAALSKGLTSAQGPVNDKPASARSLNIIEPPYDYCVAFSETFRLWRCTRWEGLEAREGLSVSVTPLSLVTCS